MRKKILNPEERQKEFYSGEKLTWGSDFPFNTLNTPPRITIGVAWHWYEPMKSVATGTAYVVRLGDSEAPIKIDGYSLHPNSDMSAVILNIKDPYLPYHHIKSLDELPEFIKTAPPEILAKIQSAFDKDGGQKI